MTKSSTIKSGFNSTTVRSLRDHRPLRPHQIPSQEGPRTTPLALDCDRRPSECGRISSRSTLSSVLPHHPELSLFHTLLTSFANSVSRMANSVKPQSMQTRSFGKIKTGCLTRSCHPGKWTLSSALNLREFSDIHDLQVIASPREAVVGTAPLSSP